MSNEIVVNGDVIPVIPDTKHGFLLTTELVAKGYGVSEIAIRQHKVRHAEELIEGKHWILSSVTNCNARNITAKTTLWTYMGIMRLSRFINGDRSIEFYNRIEDHIFSSRETTEFAAMLADPENMKLLVDDLVRVSRENKIAMARVAELTGGLDLAITQLEEQQPAVDMYETLCRTGELFSLKDLSAFLNLPNLGQNNTCNFLLNEGIILDSKLPYQKFMRYFVVHKIKLLIRGKDEVVNKTYATAEGARYIFALVKRRIQEGILTPTGHDTRGKFRKRLRRKDV